MTNEKSRVSILVILNDFFREFTGVAKTALTVVEVCIGYPNIGATVDGVDVFKDLLPNQFIIPVNDDEDLMRFTELISSPTDVGHGHMAFLVDDNLDLLRRDVPLLHQLPKIGTSVVLGSIVDEDDAVVIVVLLQD